MSRAKVINGVLADTIKAILADLDSMHYQFRGSQVLRWLLDVILFQIGTTKSPPDVPIEAIPIVQKCMATYADAVRQSDPFEDLLGTVYMNLATKYARDGLAQYFSPATMARLTAELIWTPPDYSRDQLVSALEPCVGSGAKLLAMMRKVLDDDGPSKLLKWSLTGVDLDPVCAKMFAVQMMSNVMFKELPIGEIVAIHGDSLVPSRVWNLVLHVSHGSVKREHLQGPLLCAHGPRTCDQVSLLNAVGSNRFDNVGS